MTFFRPMDINDCYQYNNINYDPFTANFSPDFYVDYLIYFQEQCFVCDGYDRPAGYMIGKDEARDKDYHVHVSAVTVAPEFRR